MARREWAEQIIAKHERKDDWGIEYVSSTEVQRLLLKEHARAVRIVKAEIKRVHMDERNYGIADQIIIVTALERVLAALMKGMA